MATTHPTTARAQRARRNRSIADLKSKLEVAQLFIDVLCYVQPTPVQLLTRSQRLRIGDVSKVTGADQQTIIRRGVELFLRQEAPVYLA